MPHSVIIVLDGSIDDIIGKEDGEFYRELLQISLSKGNEEINIRISFSTCNINEDRSGRKTSL